MARAEAIGKMVAKPVFGLVLRSVVSIAYEFALASLVPLTILLLTPGFMMTYGFVKAAVIALGVMIAGFTILLVYKKRLSSTLLSVGLMTIVPGVLAILVTLWSPQALFDFVAKYLVGFESIEPILEGYLEHAVPQANLVGFVYTLLGLLIFGAGLHLRFAGYENGSKR